MGLTTGSQNNPYDDRDFASRDTSFDQSPTSVNPSADYGNEPTTVQPAAVPAGGAAAGAGAAGYAATQHFDSPSQYSDDTALALDADSAAAAQAEEEKHCDVSTASAAPLISVCSSSVSRWVASSSLRACARSLASESPLAFPDWSLSMLATRWRISLLWAFQ